MAADEQTQGVRPSEGWGVIHLFLRVDRGAPADGLVETIERFTAVDPQQVVAFSVLGGKAEVGLMALGPDLDALDVFTKEIFAGPVECLDSFVSFTELSEYTTTEDEPRASPATWSRSSRRGGSAWRTTTSTGSTPGCRAARPSASTR